MRSDACKQEPQSGSLLRLQTSPLLSVGDETGWVPG